MKTTINILMGIHGIIHIMGFVKAYGYGAIPQLTKDVSKPMGILWLLGGLLFLVTIVLNAMKRDVWPVFALIAVVLSQLLIFTVWKDAKFGTIVNVIILVAAIIAFTTTNFENSYKRDVLSAIEKTSFSSDILTERDIENLPPPVQNYLKYVEVVGKPKVQNVKIVFEGEMRDKKKDWFTFTSEQYNFFDEPTRLFFMKSRVSGLATHGYHSYQNDRARMHIKLLSLFSIVDFDKPELFPTETVTYFNDMCLFAPAALIDDRISWEPLDDLSAKATFVTNNTRISAILYFNEKGQLVNFVSNNRISIDKMKTFPFSTPANAYKNLNGYHLPTYGEAVWHYPDGEFVYGKFKVKSVEYNVVDFN